MSVQDTNAAAPRTDTAVGPALAAGLYALLWRTTRPYRDPAARPRAMDAAAFAPSGGDVPSGGPNPPHPSSIGHISSAQHTEDAEKPGAPADPTQQDESMHDQGLAATGDPMRSTR